MKSLLGKKKVGGLTKKGKLFCIVGLAIPVIHFLFFTILSNGGTILLAFQDFDMDKGDFVWVGLANFEKIPRILTAPENELGISLRNSLLFFVANNFVILPLSLFCSILCYKRMPGGNFFRIIFFLPSVISPVIVAMVFNFAFDSSFGFINDIVEAMGLGKYIPIEGWLASDKTAMPLLMFYCVWIGIGGSIIVFTGAISRIPEELIELERLYGLGIVKSTFYVTLPLIGSTVSIIFLQGLGVILGYYIGPLLITNGAGNTATLGLYLINLVQGSRTNYGFAATITITSALIMAPIVIGCKILISKVFPEYEY